MITLFMFSLLNILSDIPVRSHSICCVVKLYYNVLGDESSRLLLCNGERTVSKSDGESEQSGCEVNSEAVPRNAAASSVNVSVNEQLLPSSVGNSLPLTDTPISRSTLNDTSEATSLPHLAAENIGQSVVAQP